MKDYQVGKTPLIDLIDFDLFHLVDFIMQVKDIIKEERQVTDSIAHALSKESLQQIYNTPLPTCSKGSVSHVCTKRGMNWIPYYFFKKQKIIFLSKDG